jgi:NADPH-dependent 2,4-dienoyl-CoA reductase/sulfur reductase-like enzyme
LPSRGIPYDAIVIATGTVPRTLPDAAPLDGVHTFRTWDDALAIKRRVESGARTVVIGAGFIGSEVASSAAKLGCPVTVVEAAASPLARAFGPELGARLGSMHGASGTRLLCGSSIVSLEGSGSVDAVLLEDGTRLPAELVVVGIGVDPAVGWLANRTDTGERRQVRRNDQNLWVRHDVAHVSELVDWRSAMPVT